MVACGTLTVVCVHLAVGELGQPWGGFSLTRYRTVSNGYDTDLVYFDYILAVQNTPVQSAREFRDLLQHTSPGQRLTYLVARGQQQFTVTIPVQETTWHRLLSEFGLPLLT